MNQTLITEFILLGFSNLLHLQGLLFCMVLFMYMVTVMGNTLIIFVVTVDPALHSPMYFFLDTYLFEMQAVRSMLLFLMFPFVLILVSYVHILTTILRMRSAEGRCKAFSTSSW
uniref:G-protein coupled receptors family 1 profile domain-containing protein n=1 Tax=Chelonoidis abingdonii TaxID=106734 RepID=A0A8C0HF82_CHEAB